MRALTGGWGLHVVVLAVLAAAGVAITVAERSGPAPGGWISLRGLLSFVAWLAIGSYAIVSTFTFAFLRPRIGAPLAYLVAVPITAVLVPLVVRGVRFRQLAQMHASDAALVRDLGSRLVLESWSMEERPDGRFHFTAAVRALKDGAIGFEPSADAGEGIALEAVVPRGLATTRRVKAGEVVRMEADARRTVPDPFTAVHLIFDSWLAVPEASAPGGVAMREAGTVTYSQGAEGESLVNQATLRRPLPSPSPP
jgi:hypothetical protein